MKYDELGNFFLIVFIVLMAVLLVMGPIEMLSSKISALGY